MNRRSDTSATYLITVRGELDERYAYLFEGMTMTHAEGTTVFSGVIRDQAHLYGLIERIEELALQLLTVEQVDLGRQAVNQERDGE